MCSVYICNSLHTCIFLYFQQAYFFSFWKCCKAQATLFFRILEKDIYSLLVCINVIYFRSQSFWLFFVYWNKMEQLLSFKEYNQVPNMCDVSKNCFIFNTSCIFNQVEFCFNSNSFFSSTKKKYLCYFPFSNFSLD